MYRGESMKSWFLSVTPLSREAMINICSCRPSHVDLSHTKTMPVALHVISSWCLPQIGGGLNPAICQAAPVNLKK